MDDFRKLARDPKHRRRFEKLLFLAAQRNDDDHVAERLSWGIDPNCTFGKGRTPLIACVRSPSAAAATVRALLKGGADPDLSDESGLNALDYARNKLYKLLATGYKPRKSPNLDENNQLKLCTEEQAEFDEMRRDVNDPEYVRMWWKDRLRAARRSFNDPAQYEQIVEILEAAGGLTDRK
jgi:hypothetical protein